MRGLEPGPTAATRPATLSGPGPRPRVSGLELRPLDTAAVLRVLIEEVRSAAADRLGFAMVADREPFPVADRDRAATVLLKIMTAIAADPRFQLPADQDPVGLLQDVLRRGADQALGVLARLPVAADVPRMLVATTRDIVAGALVEPVRQSTALVRSLQQALIIEARRELSASRPAGALSPTAGVPHYATAMPAESPALETLVATILARSAAAGPATQEQPATLWARLEDPVRAAFGAAPEVERALTVLRERVFTALAPGLVPLPPPRDEHSARRFLDRIATTLATAISRPFSMPASANDARGIAAAVIDALRQIADHAPAAGRHETPLASALDAVRGLLARESSPAAAPMPARVPVAAVVEARALLLHLLGSPEAVDAARRDPVYVGRWLGEVAAALARDVGLPYRLDLPPLRRRLGLKRPNLRAAGPERDDDAITAIERRLRQGPSDTTSLDD